jgi:predicted nucleic acid-binding protein
MILVDTSVVIDYTRGKDLKLQGIPRANSVAICGVVRAEILCGARNVADRGNLLTELAVFQYLPTPEAMWDVVGDNLAQLRRKGLTVPVPDAIVATLGIDLDIEVWSRDLHFPAIQLILPALKLFQEPP